MDIREQRTAFLKKSDLDFQKAMTTARVAMALFDMGMEVPRAEAPAVETETPAPERVVATRRPRRVRDRRDVIRQVMAEDEARDAEVPRHVFLVRLGEVGDGVRS